MSIRIAICDDEKEQIIHLTKIIEKWAQDMMVSLAICEFDSAEAFLFEWHANKFDVLLLDIQMHGKDGMSLAKEIREIDKRLVIIFVTGYDNYMSIGYDVSAMHYLLKPINEEKLRNVLDQAVEKLSAAPRMIVLNTVEGVVRLKAEDIIYAEMFSHYAEIYSTGCTVRLKIKISDLEILLGDGFLRCHRSYIAGMAHVEKVTRTAICLTGGKMLPLSRKLYDAAHRAFMEYNWGGKD